MNDMETKQTEIYSETTTAFSLGYVAIKIVEMAMIFGICTVIIHFYSTVWGCIIAVCCAVALVFPLLSFTYPNILISVTSQSITVTHGLLKRVIFWEDIIDCHTEDFSMSSIFTTSIKVSKGEWRLMYYVHKGTGSQRRVVLKLKRGKIKEFIFFTRDPDAVMDLIKKQVVDSQNRGTYETEG